MPAPKGNQFWKKRSSHGRKPIFAEAEVLWDACEQYFEWCEANPLKEDRVFHYQGKITRTTVNKMRAFTLGGMLLYINISHDAWIDYRKKKDLGGVTKEVDEIIRNQKFCGAAADLLNANIIARDLGLADKIDAKLSPATFIINK